MQFNPRNYQKKAIRHIIDHPQAGLFLDMGLGKTVSTLTAIEELIYDRAEVSKVLVVAPARVAKITWPEELKKWDHLGLLRMSVLTGGPEQRKEALRRQADIYVISRDSVAWLARYLNTFWPFDMVVLDELSSFKSSKAQRFRALKMRPYKRVVGLTGTPGNLMDLWAEMFLLDKGARLGKTITSYRDQYFVPGAHNGMTVYEWLPRPETEKIVQNRIKDICISMAKEDYLDLPERIDQMIYVDIDKKIHKKCKQLRQEYITKLDDNEITASNAAVVSGILQQMANGAVYINEDHEFEEIHDEKLKAVAELIEETNEPVLIYYNYRHDLARLKRTFPEAREISSIEDVKAWNRGEISIALGHPRSIGHGINLQDGGHIIIWFGLDWWLEGYEQANARLHRQGQTKPVLVYHIITRGTIDERIMKALAKKESDQNAILDAVKACLEE